MHNLQAAMPCSSENDSGLHGVHSPTTFVANVMPHGGLGSLPAAQIGQRKHLTLVFLSSKTVYVSGGQ